MLHPMYKPRNRHPVLDLTRSTLTDRLLCICVRNNGFGRHIWALPAPKDRTQKFLEILYTYEIEYYFQ